MPQAVIVVFMLFFAVLAFAWFYLQRAKARSNAASEPTHESTAAPTPAEPTAAPASAEHTDHSH